MGYRYAIIGSGMQGTAAAYDLAQYGEADEVRLLDVDVRRARSAADRVNRLVGRELAKAGVVDATDKTSASQVLEGMHACLSAVPYFFNVNLARAAIQARSHFNDLGGNTKIVEEELALDRAAKDARVSVVPDCGVAPGMANTLAVYAIRSIEQPQHVHVRCGGLPQNKQLPLGYKKLFALEGLTNEYFGKAIALREGKIIQIDTFDDLETLELPAPIGPVEAFSTSGGTSTCPYTFQGKLETYDYKTIRYPGHHQALKLFKELGFLGLEPIEVKGHSVVPRDAFHAIMQRAWDHPSEPDLLVLRIDVIGMHAGARTRVRIQIIDRQDPRTGFSAMERTTAFSAAIVTALQAKGRTPIGAVPLETAVDPHDFMRELARRDIPVEETRVLLES